MPKPTTCQYCGASLQPDWTFCKLCGAPIDEQEAPSAPQAPEQPAPSRPVHEAPRQPIREWTAPSPAQISLPKRPKWIAPACLGCGGVTVLCLLLTGLALVLRFQGAGL